MAAVSTGGDQDQPVVVRPGERDLRPGGRQVQAHPLQGLQAHPPPPGFSCPPFLGRIYANTKVQSRRRYALFCIFNGSYSAINLKAASFLRGIFCLNISNINA